MFVCMYDTGKLCVLVWGCASRGQRLKLSLSITLWLIFKKDAFGCTDWPASLRDPPSHTSWYWDYRCESLPARFLCRCWGLKSDVTLILTDLAISAIQFCTLQVDQAITVNSLKKHSDFFPGRIFTGWNHLRKDKNIWLRQTVMLLWFSELNRKVVLK